MRIEKGVYLLQGKNYWFILHIGFLAFYFGEGRAKYAHYLRIMTYNRWFAFRKGIR
jgi:hypothetical protein